jgi:hypothetical protein
MASKQKDYGTTFNRRASKTHERRIKRIDYLQCFFADRAGRT